jgi:methionyl-tRNA formyltransferase
LSSPTDRPRAIFFGTPEFAVPTLRALAGLSDVVAVITQPDRPAGRGMKLSPPPVKVLAEQLGLPIHQPTKVRTPEFAEQLAALRADVAVVIAYGRILPVAVLSAPRLGCINLHASLLPKLRGAAPIQWAIVNGEAETGVCLMQMDEGMDTGDVLASVRVSIGADTTGDELTQQLSAASAALLERELTAFLAGQLPRVAQDHARATHAPILRKEHGQIDWARSAQQVHDLVRGMASWPGAYTWLAEARLKVHRTRVLESASAGVPGAVIAVGASGIDVACGQGAVRLLDVQPEGKGRMPSAAFAAGRRLPIGARFDKSPA